MGDDVLDPVGAEGRLGIGDWGLGIEVQRATSLVGEMSLPARFAGGIEDWGLGIGGGSMGALKRAE
jgi:hypothetical protein